MPMNTIKTRMLRRSVRQTSGPLVNGRHCLVCDLAGAGGYSSIGVPLAWARKMGLHKAQPPTHRVSWVLSRGKPIPAGRKVLHRCDVMRCVEPRHLFLGSQADNVRDMVRKGRNSDNRGSKNPAVKLSERQVREIFFAEGNQRLLAEAYGVSLPLVEKIKSGKAWPHLNLKDSK